MFFRVPEKNEKDKKGGALARRDRVRVLKERGTLSSMTFAALFVSEKREKKKSYFKYLHGRAMFAPTM